MLRTSLSKSLRSAPRSSLSRTSSSRRSRSLRSPSSILPNLWSSTSPTLRSSREPPIPTNPVIPSPLVLLLVSDYCRQGLFNETGRTVSTWLPARIDPLGQHAAQMKFAFLIKLETYTSPLLIHLLLSFKRNLILSLPLLPFLLILLLFRLLCLFLRPYLSTTSSSKLTSTSSI